jgi:pyruvate,water dikinase
LRDHDPGLDPALSPRRAGLVTDIGGVAAHGSLTAREYGIPPVMGTGTGTERSANGRTITVDATPARGAGRRCGRQ